MKKKGFTLIELLVVIAIIAILAAILFPVFAQAKAAAKKTTALAHIKQTATATLMYNGDADDGYPQGTGACWWQPIDGGWTFSIIPYMKSYDVLRDPGDPKSKADWPSWMSGVAGAVNISFAANGYMRTTNYENGGNWGMYGIMGMDQAHDQVRSDGSCTSTAWMAKGTANNSEVTIPAGTIMFAERYNSYPIFGPSNFFSGVTWWDWVGGGGSAIPSGVNDPWWVGSIGTRNANTPYSVNGVLKNKDNRLGGVSAPWASKAVFVFTDSHAASMNPIQTNPDQVNQKSKNMWDALRPESG